MTPAAAVLLAALVPSSVLAGLILFFVDYSLARVWMRDVEIGPIAAKAALHGVMLGTCAALLTLLILAVAT